MKKTVLFFSIGVLLLLGYQFLHEDAYTEYVHYQQAYGEKLKELGVKIDFPIQIRQLVLPGNNMIDRCVNCHVGMEDPRMKDAPLPIRTHSGSFLKYHNLQKIGCTNCHDGQGRALTKVEAHGNTAKNWERKRFAGIFVQASCARCHPADSPVMMTEFVKGRDLFRSKGCLGCHKAEDKGGNIGPDLSTIANASPHLKMPVDPHLAEEKFRGDVNLAYIFESIFRPKVQPHNSKMKEYNFTADQAMSLAIYLKSFTHQKPVMETQRSGSLEDRRQSGQELFGIFCNACHGEDGQGTKMMEFEKITPAILNPSFLAIIDRDFLIERISNPGKSIMPAWGKSGGLTRTEIEKIADFMLSKKPVSDRAEKVFSLPGKAQNGKVIFQAKCSGCHGMQGEHETDLVGPTLSSQDWLVYADQNYLYRTIVEGRSHTAMPAWSMLSDENLADLMAFFQEMRSPRVQNFSDAQTAMTNEKAGEFGNAIFRKSCASCHGLRGEGGIGTSLNSPEALTNITDRFIFDTITKGRDGTAMGAHAYLSGEEIGWITAFIRSLNEKKARIHFNNERPILGRESNGKAIFERVCAQCHGERGKGHIGPAIGNPKFLETADDRFLKETIAFGRSGTGMLANLQGQGGTTSSSEEEIDDVVVYLRSLAETPFNNVGLSLSQGDIELGRQTFARNCRQCHGTAGEGGTGPAIGRKDFLSQVHDGYLLGTITNGRTGTEMKGFTQAVGGLSSLSDHEIGSVVVYLRSQADSHLMRPKAAALGVFGNGKENYLRSCAPCHGTQKAEGIAPNLFNPQFLASAHDSYIQATMSLGRPGTAMRSVVRGGGGVVELSSMDVNNVIKYIRETSSTSAKK